MAAGKCEVCEQALVRQSHEKEMECDKCGGMIEAKSKHFMCLNPVCAFHVCGGCGKTKRVETQGSTPLRKAKKGRQDDADEEEMEEVRGQEELARRLDGRMSEAGMEERLLSRMRSMMTEVVREEVGRDLRVVKGQMEEMRKSMEE
eukprot:7992250-Karenia_brevis.AAC.1